MASYALWPHQCPSSLPAVHQRSPRKPTRHMCSRIPGQHFNLFRFHRTAPGPCMRSTQATPRSRAIREPQEVQFPHRYHPIPGIYINPNKTPHGPDKGSCDPELARTMECPQHAVIPQVCELLPPLHCRLLTVDPLTDKLVQENHTLDFQQDGNHHIPIIEEHILHSTSTLPLGPRPPNDGRNGCI